MVLKQRLKEAQSKFTASQSSKVTPFSPVIVGGRSRQISISHLSLRDPKAVSVELSWEMAEQAMPAPMPTPKPDGPTPGHIIQPPPVADRSLPASPVPEPSTNSTPEALRQAPSVMAPIYTPGRPAAASSKVSAPCAPSSLVKLIARGHPSNNSLWMSAVSEIVCQYMEYERFPSPGDPNYSTMLYNGRRYGQVQPYPRDSYNRDGNLQGQDRQFNQVDPTNIPLPGVLRGWRPDLQGKQRPDSLQLPRDVTVTTTYGQVQGFKVYLYDNPDPKSGYRPGQTPVERIQGEVTVFLGIPYALPPIQEGRFKPPRIHRGWQLLQAVEFGPACPQHVRYTGATKGIRDMDEDCLYLNVYTPSVTSGLAEKYPVMVYIHGGEFVKGASNTFPGHIMASFYKVVVVTINYRLGALGFLSTGDANSPGNYGMLDQAMALRWVYDNIEFFNGDRRSITLFGPDAGAASAGLLMVAPRTRDIVTRVIAQSGSALSDWALIVDRYRAQNTSRVYGQILGCSIESSWKLVNCLKQGRSFFELGNAEFQPQVGLFPWGPVLDGNFSVPDEHWYEGWRQIDWHFLDHTAEYLVRNKKFNRGLSYMSGVTTQEASTLVYQNDSLANRGYIVDNHFFDQKVKELVLRYNYTLNPIGIYNAIKYMYTHWPDPNNTDFVRNRYIDVS
uniref:Carboxylesterase type B domain-containing protein n=1 Tax=Timema shepardi TaxID=629360 RepID=A0A7R9G2C0_TIMSH|nr:unnamed protein product [Timema shepardi]